MLGETISHYKILEKIGEGGMGIVYKAKDLKLDRLVALKFLPLHLSADEEEKQRFIHEAKTASALDHPNICNIHEIDEVSIEDRDLMFICMAYYQGETLEKKIGHRQLKIDEAINIAIQVSEGLARAHEAGIVHRDIKPANIMITDRDEVKILDFGLAKLRGRTKLTKTGTTLGTLAYMSPEQARGDEMDHRSDIFSFGAVLYEMLTNLPAFKKDNDGAVVYSILEGEPEPMAGLRTGVPMELERIVSKALAKNPDHRYQYVEEMRVDLKGGLTLKVRKDSGYGPEKDESLAVMPFSNASGKEEIEYLSDGITESLITNLSQISNFKVISRTSVFHYKGQQIEIRKVARELNVNKLLLGWVNQRADNVSIGIELVEGRDNSQIWGEQYTRKFTDVVQIQEEIVRDISTKLKLKLTKKEKKSISKHYKIGNEAYQLFLNGRYHWNKRTAVSFKQSISFYEQAIEKDPTYALAYTGLSDSYALIGIYGYLPAKDVWPKAKAAALKAKKLDPDMAEAHNALGAVESSYEWNWVKAEKEFQYSISLKPNYATAHQWYAGQLWILGKFDEALSEIGKAQEIDPLSLQICTDVGRLHCYAGDYDLAVQEYQKVLELDSNFFPAHLWLGLTLLEKRDFGLAIKSLQTALTLSGKYAAVTATLGYAFGISGNRAEAEKIMKELKNRARNEYIQPTYFAWVHVSLNELDAAFKYFDKAFDERSWWLVYTKIWPFPEQMIRDARYTKLLKKIGLPV